MKLRINKACDLSSISVLPPRFEYLPLLPMSPISDLSFFVHSCFDLGRRTGGSGADAASLGRSQASQPRSQSQQSFSQGASLSQLSQTSLEENLMSDQRFFSHDNSSKRSSLAPGTSTREESQLQLSRASNSVLHRWNPTTVSDSRYQVSEELEHRFRLMESSINRMCMILDSVQNDVMQLNRAMKEVSLETEGIRQKMLLLDNSMQQILKGEDDIKSFLEGRLKSLPDQLMKNSNLNKLNEIFSTVSALPEQFEARLLKLQNDICRIFTREMEVMAGAVKSFNNKHAVLIRSPANNISTNTKQVLKSQIPVTKVAATHLITNKRSIPVPIVEEETKILEPKFAGSSQMTALNREERPFRTKVQDNRVIIDSDDDSDGSSSCLIVKKGKGVKLQCMRKFRIDLGKVPDL
uniref:Protein PAIR1 n=1 Tax=Ananas comosus var. bracteatus TaxID=296719 RepID=A0A6V7PWQ4_ANACO|nr:unnamed protein product [Ananas comosus var. bracteatus]